MADPPGARSRIAREGRVPRAPLPPAESRGPSAQAYAPGYHPPSARAAQWLKCAYDTRRVRANSTNAATTTTHSTPPHAHRTAHTTFVFQSVLQLFLGALAVHSGAQLLVIHVPRVPASDGRTSLSPAQPCGQRCVCMGGEGSPLRLRGTAAGPLTAVGGRTGCCISGPLFDRRRRWTPFSESKMFETRSECSFFRMASSSSLLNLAPGTSDELNPASTSDALLAQIKKADATKSASGERTIFATRFSFSVRSVQVAREVNAADASGEPGLLNLASHASPNRARCACSAPRRAEKFAKCPLS